MENICVSCKVKITNDTKASKFPCPNCGSLIIRCGKCRTLSVEWVCPNCGFKGP